MRKYTSIIMFAITILFCTNNVVAQFHTIESHKYKNYIIISKPNDTNTDREIVNPDTTELPILAIEQKRSEYKEAREKAKQKKRKQHETFLTNPKRNKVKTAGLTIISLYEEIVRNNIQHPKIVLAQAILETGWFRSSVCRNKGNLFGLTNPKTGQYYEFNDWRESVKAYYDKVQYRYKGGNYLLWLKKIGYAEDPRYVSSLMDILEKHLL